MVSTGTVHHPVASHLVASHLVACQPVDEPALRPLRGDHEFRARMGELLSVRGLGERFATAFGMNRLMRFVSPSLQGAAGRIGLRTPAGFALALSIGSAAILSGAQVVYQQVKDRDPSSAFQGWWLSFLYVLPQTLLSMTLGVRFGLHRTFLGNLAQEPFGAAVAVAETHALAAAGLVQGPGMGLLMEFMAEAVEGAVGQMATGASLVVSGPGGEPLRKIPATMATKHPDNSMPPPWRKNGSCFVSAAEEAEETLHDLRCRSVDEVMFDWEGRHADSELVDRLLALDADFFTRHQLGRDRFLTVRIPSLSDEGGERLGRAYVTIVSAAHTARRYGVHTPPLFEVILPMTDSAGKLLRVLRIWPEAVEFGRAVFEKRVVSHDALEVIPLFERVGPLFGVDSILSEFAVGYEGLRGRPPTHLRPFLARSDPAVDAGYVAARLAARGALSEVYRFSKRTGIPVHPIIGAGSLPFRGAVSPQTVDRFIGLYGGARTVTVQSAFRCDYPDHEVRTAIRRLQTELPGTQPIRFDPADFALMQEFAALFSGTYRPVVQRLAPEINRLAALVPSHRERLPETGMLGYARNLGDTGVRLPRAIKFAAVFYSLGVPPEFIGTGRALKTILDRGQEGALLRFLPTLREDLKGCGRYLNREVLEGLEGLAKKDPAWAAILEDVTILEQWLGERFGPLTIDETRHQAQTSIIYRLLDQPGREEVLRDAILAAARARKSLG